MKKLKVLSGGERVRCLFSKLMIMGTNCLKAYVDTLKDLNVPIVLDLDIGHLPPQMPVISGAMGDVKVKDNSLTLTHRLC